jgi:hypothetical protein
MDSGYGDQVVQSARDISAAARMKGAANISTIPEIIAAPARCNGRRAEIWKCAVNPLAAASASKSVDLPQARDRGRQLASPLVHLQADLLRAGAEAQGS